MAAPVTPHLAMPPVVIGGQFVTVEQGSVRHLEDQAEVVCRTRPGDLDADPDFGLRSLVARLTPAAPEILAALEEYVPGTEYLVEEDVSQLQDRIRNVSLDVQTQEQGS